MFIVGRATRYEACLYETLKMNSDKYNIDLFMSLNDEPCEYFDIMQKTLEPWLKDIYIKPYNLPSNFIHTKQNNLSGFLLVGDKYLPMNQMSMFWNEGNAYQMILNYETKHNFQYDCIVKYRADVEPGILPDFEKYINLDRIYSATPVADFTTVGLYPRRVICDALAWGKHEMMKYYCGTHDYVMKKLGELNGDYYIAFECSLADNIEENKVPVEYVEYKIRFDKNRRMFDDKRVYYRPARLGMDPISIKNFTFSNIPFIPEHP